MQVNWNDVKEDYKRKDDEIESLKKQLLELNNDFTKTLRFTNRTLDIISSSIRDPDADQCCYTLQRHISELLDKMT